MKAIRKTFVLAADLLGFCVLGILFFATFVALQVFGRPKS